MRQLTIEQDTMDMSIVEINVARDAVKSWPNRAGVVLPNLNCDFAILIASGLIAEESLWGWTGWGVSHNGCLVKCVSRIYLKAKEFICMPSFGMLKWFLAWKLDNLLAEIYGGLKVIWEGYKDTMWCGLPKGGMLRGHQLGNMLCSLRQSLSRAVVAESPD